MKIFTVYSILFYATSITSIALAQPKIQLDTTIYDFGTVKETPKLEATFKFRNIGTQPLIIYNVQTSGGGLHGDWPKAPIPPGKRGEFKLIYDGSRVGPINKMATIISNAANENYKEVKVIGKILQKRRSIELSSKVADIGTIPFGEVDSISFLVTNTGEAPLNFKYILESKDAAPIDLFYISRTYLRLEKSENNFKKKLNFNENTFYPKDTIQVKIFLRNTLGNVGKKERHFYFKYNTNDSIKYTVKVNYTGVPWNKKIYERHDPYNHALYEYENGKLKKHTEFEYDDVASTITHFEDGDLINIIRINPFNGNQTEYIYKDGLLIEKKEPKRQDQKD